MKITTSDLIKKIFFLFLIITGMYFARAFLIPFTLGSVIAMIFLPVCKWLENKGISRAIAPLLCIFLILLLVSGLVSMLGWQISELSKDAVSIEKKILETGAAIREYIFEHSGISKTEQVRLLNEQNSMFTNAFMNVLGSITSILMQCILILVYIVLLLFYRSHILQFFIKLSDVHQRENVKELLISAAKISQQYLFGLAKMIFLLWIMYSIGFAIAGVKNPVFFAVMCGMLEIIPFIGNITGTGITIFVALVQGGGAGLIISIIITYAIIQFIQGWILEPLILGPQVKINPLFTILALVIGELIWGIPGVILAIPLTGMLKILCDHIEPLKPYGFLIGERKSPPSEKKLQKKLLSWFKRGAR
jgi:predicted PurR-regulated permease PerM